MFMSSQFDVSKPVFDLLSLRSVRGDAVVRYDSLNQSEPLRITLYALFGLTFLSAPWLAEPIGYDAMNTPTTVASILFALASGGLFVRECSRRSKQLSRIERELNTEILAIRMPTNAFSELPFSKPVTLKELKLISKPPRIIALYGNEEKLREALSSLAIYSQRLAQASVFVVAVSSSSSSDTKKEKWQTLNPSCYKTWLGDAYEPQIWREYFRGLSENDDKDSIQFRWFGLNSSGRSFGSGDDEIPQWLQMLGLYMRPTDFLEMKEATDTLREVDSTEEIKVELMEKVKDFYSALTTGDQAGIDAVFSKSSSQAVTEVRASNSARLCLAIFQKSESHIFKVLESGGRIDSWKECLAEGARPSNMKISGVDATVLSDTEAYTTVVEFPANTGMDSATLLAVQHWTRTSTEKAWTLDLHQTIPWSLEAKAQGTLRCDCRGCVALTRSRERRTFGGVIG